MTRDMTRAEFRAALARRGWRQELMWITGIDKQGHTCGIGMVMLNRGRGDQNQLPRVACQGDPRIAGAVMTSPETHRPWRQNPLAGNVAPIVDGEPQTGYYRVRRKGQDGFFPAAFLTITRPATTQRHGPTISMNSAR